ncbi:MAG: arginine kinase [Rickettsiales bacterium]|nr:arginine kinase [Rickettsiales bacterium]
MARNIKKSLCMEALEMLDESEKSILRTKKTKFGVTLNHIIKSGVENLDSRIGCYAGDTESYTMYAPVFSYVIKEYHKYDPYILGQSKRITKFNFTKENRTILSGNVVSARMRVARNLSSFPFPSSMSKEQRKQVETVVLAAIKKLPQEYQGTYYSIESLSKEEYEKMVKEHLLFKAGDKYLKSAGILDDWPIGRGTYVSGNKKFMIWINEEDHMRIIYLDKTANLGEIYNKFTQALNLLEKYLDFAYDNKLGYLNSGPTNIGTALRASVHIKLNNLDMENIKLIAAKYNLAVRGTHEEHSKVLQGVYDISNSIRLGTTIEAILASLVDGAISLVKEDKNVS